MKNLSGTFKLLSIAALATCIVACAAFTASKHPGIVYNKEYIVIKPAAQLSPQACNDINAILPRYDKHLYRLHTYKRGALKGQKGTLALGNIQSGLAAEVSKQAKDMQYTGCAVAFGDSTTFQNLMPQREDLLRNLKSILRKYNK